jgi:hypothetical protein
MRCRANWTRTIRMRPETREAMEMLFSAKWNLPEAAKHCKLTHKEMKITFNEYCNFHQPTYINFEDAVQLHLDYDY